MNIATGPVQRSGEDQTPEPGASPEIGSVDLEELARLILSLLKEELWIERERRGWQ